MFACSNGPREAMVFESLLGLSVTLALGVYLVVTLVHPERF
jgi:K+-transporting ATPase KdpF subunit